MPQNDQDGPRSARDKKRGYAVDVGGARALFIKSQLNRALADRSGSLVTRASREFRRYFKWFRDSLPERDKKAIAEQLRQLAIRARRIDSPIIR